MLISRLIKTELTQRVIYRYVGKKFTEQIRYDSKTCKQFDLLLQSKLSTKQKDKSDHVNRLFLGCLFSRIIGSNFPLSIYLSQEVNFNLKINHDEDIIGEVEVVKDLGKNRYELKTTCTNLKGETVMEGKALILQE